MVVNNGSNKFMSLHPDVSMAARSLKFLALRRCVIVEDVRDYFDTSILSDSLPIILMPNASYEIYMIMHSLVKGVQRPSKPSLALGMTMFHTRHPPNIKRQPTRPKSSTLLLLLLLTLFLSPKGHHQQSPRFLLLPRDPGDEPAWAGPFAFLAGLALELVEADRPVDWTWGEDAARCCCPPSDDGAERTLAGCDDALARTSRWCLLFLSSNRPAALFAGVLFFPQARLRSLRLRRTPEYGLPPVSGNDGRATQWSAVLIPAGGKTARRHVMLSRLSSSRAVSMTSSQTSPTSVSPSSCISLWTRSDASRFVRRSQMPSHARRTNSSSPGHLA